jgi:dTDP-4-dehydrorhamnose 3,5-epimerase-like enzyme
MATIVGGETAGKVKREVRVVFTFNGKVIATSRIYFSANTEAKIEAYALSEQRKAGVSIPKGTTMGTQWL